MRFCKGVCIRYTGKRIGPSWYKSGFKRCGTCAKFIKFEGLNCPCCGSKLSIRPVRPFKKKEVVDYGYRYK